MSQYDFSGVEGRVRVYYASMVATFIDGMVQRILAGSTVRGVKKKKKKREWKPSCV